MKTIAWSIHMNEQENFDGYFGTEYIGRNKIEPVARQY